MSLAAAGGLVLAGEADLAESRKDITSVTLEIFRLCGERLRIAEKIGDIKACRKLPVENLHVEEELRNKVLEVCRENSIDTGFCVKLLDLLLQESKRVQREAVR